MAEGMIETPANGDPEDVEIRHRRHDGAERDEAGARARQPAGDQRRPDDGVGERRRHDSGLLDRIGGARHGHASRWTVAGENAGRQMATYSAPPGSGLLYRIHSPGAVTTAWPARTSSVPAS